MVMFNFNQISVSHLNLRSTEEKCEIYSNINGFFFQAVSRKSEEEKPSKFGGDRTESVESARISFLHFRPLLGAVFCIKYTFCRLSHLRGTRTCRCGMSVVGLRQFNNKPNYLYNIQ